eukprot:CAMPEP_0206013466 /NCGR_PEP_ID=MMETSP1464-20131121/16558_1 /ASSEMBLY_ACC=CAM_ASM_001124 /TAXON_ID=119497 /ORGANISM="Exanthemachrysis gayraliae, Strain RCC1523" /LENGTH=103 /DNA_ID=CAMNT_0053387185 /DNA_START=14 /DNA_END=325 /DNA_ORIENTATION=-
MELPFLFHQPEEGLAFDRDEFQLSHTMLGAWAAFAKTGGQPSLPLDTRQGAGLSSEAKIAKWPPWTIDTGATLDLRWVPRLDLIGETVCDPVCDYWDTTGYRF